MSVPEGDFDKIIGADDPSFSRASITCLQKPINHQPHPNNEDGRYQIASSDATCMESELTKIAVNRANKYDENKIHIYLKKKKGIVVVNNDESDSTRDLVSNSDKTLESTFLKFDFDEPVQLPPKQYDDQIPSSVSSSPQQIDIEMKKRQG